MRLRNMLVISGIVLSGWLTLAFGIEQTRMARSTVGCITPNVYRSAIGMQENHDSPALAKLLRSGQCTKLERGTMVTLEGSAHTGEVEVRVRGQTRGWWMGSEEVLP
jgi:hypothetical protein